MTSQCSKKKLQVQCFSWFLPFFLGRMDLMNCQIQLRSWKISMLCQSEWINGPSCPYRSQREEEAYSSGSMKSICHKFLRYEKVMDSFLPYYRHTGSEQCHSYFQSNCLSSHKSLEGSLREILFCHTRSELYDILNHSLWERERYHKLNLQNLKTGRQPTIEFRHHHSTKDEKYIVAWVCFCILFVENAAKLPLLTPGKLQDLKRSHLWWIVWHIHLVSCFVEVLLAEDNE